MRSAKREVPVDSEEAMTENSPPPAHTDQPSPRHAISETLQKYGLIIAWLAVILLFGAIRPDPYLTVPNASNILGTQAVLVIVAMGLLVALRAGLYDLSVAATLTTCSVTVGVLNAEHGWPIL